jgi:hypothetical protein
MTERSYDKVAPCITLGMKGTRARKKATQTVAVFPLPFPDIFIYS